MKVSIKDLAVDMEVKNKGVELDVYDNADKHLGDLVVTKTGLTWCNGKTKVENGTKIKWADFIAYAQSQSAAKPAKPAKAAKAAPAVKAPKASASKK